MKKTLVAFLVVISSSLAALGQTTYPPPTTCQLTAVQAPQVRGLRLGMSLDEFLALFPGSRVEFANQLARFEIPQNYGINSINVNEPARFAGDTFKGISSVQATFIDKQLGGFSLSYQNTHWAHPDEFIDKLGEFFNLPKALTWSITGRGETSVNKMVRCMGVEFSVGIQENTPQRSELGITTVPTPTEQWAQRKKEADAKAAQLFKQTFKP